MGRIMPLMDLGREGLGCMPAMVLGLGGLGKKDDT